MASTVTPEEQQGLVSRPEHDSGGLFDDCKWPPNNQQIGWGIFGVVFLVVLVIFNYFVWVLTNVGVDKLVTVHDHQVHEHCGEDVTMRNIAETIWWPGCGSNFTEGATCGEPCYSPDLVNEIIHFNKGQKPGRKVSYPNRPGVGVIDYLGETTHTDVKNVTLRGWLLEASTHSHAHHPRPRIVVQHGYTSNSNNFRVVLMAIILRQLGFDVLLNNFRDHGYSDDSESHVLEWGHAYPFDLLGAWDYLRKDPDGHLGGEIDADKVGLVGISMGAFNTVNAFGMESRVPAAWVDGPPSTPKSVYTYAVQQKLDSMGYGYLLPLLHGPCWRNTEDVAIEKNVSLTERLPSKVLPRGPDTKRPFALVGNHNDTIVPMQNVIDLANIAKDHPEKYEVRVWAVDGVCKDSNHSVDHLSHFHEYKAKLCKFWYDVFSLDAGQCPEDVETPAMHHPRGVTMAASL